MMARTLMKVPPVDGNFSITSENKYIKAAAACQIMTDCARESQDSLFCPRFTQQSFLNNPCFLQKSVFLVYGCGIGTTEKVEILLDELRVRTIL